MVKSSQLSFKEFEKKSLLPLDEITTIFTIDPISTRLAYFFYKKTPKITPNHITWVRLAFFAPLSILFLFLAPMLSLRIFYLFSAILMYIILLSDAVDGHLARGGDKKSTFGAFLDIISDRIVIILFITLLFSLGLYEGNPLITYGAVFLFVAKMYNMTVISKVYYFQQNYTKKGLDQYTMFSGLKELDTIGIGKVNSLFVKMNKYLKVKRWCEHTGAYERNLITFILPCLLLYFGLDMIAIILGYAFVILFSYFYISRTQNLIRDYGKVLKKSSKR